MHWKREKEYIDRNTNTTCGGHPLEWGELPPGWEWVEASEFEAYYVAHTNKRTQSGTPIFPVHLSMVSFVWSHTRHSKRKEFSPFSSLQSLTTLQKFLLASGFCLSPCEIRTPEVGAPPLAEPDARKYHSRSSWKARGRGLRCMRPIHRLFSWSWRSTRETAAVAQRHSSKFLS